MKYSIRLLFLFMLGIAYISFNPILNAADTASLLPNAVQQFFNNNGDPLTSGTVTTYEAGTSNLKTTWKDSAEATPNTNPIRLDAGGKAIIYGTGVYRQVVKDKNNNLIWDAVTAPGGGGSTPSAVGDGNLVGTILPWSGLIAPNQYAFAYGQEISRTTHPEFYTATTQLLNVICSSSSNLLTGFSDTTQIRTGSPVELICVPAGTTVVSKTAATVTLSNPSNISINTVATFFPWGNGNGTTTFNVPDLRGYVIAGRDNMGGTAAGRLTTTYYGANTPDALGASGGSQSHTMTISEMVLHSHNVYIRDPGHTHIINNPSYYAGTGGSGQLTAAASGTLLGNLTNSTNTTGVHTNSISNGTLTTDDNTASTGSTIPSSIVQPTITLNYVVKITPDTSTSIATGVYSIGGMSGVIACGDGILCTGNIISFNGGIADHAVAIGSNGGFVGIGPLAAGGAFVSAGVSADPILTLTPTWSGVHTFADGAVMGFGAKNLFDAQGNASTSHNDVTSSSTTAPWYWAIQDSVNAGSGNFYIPFGIRDTMVAGGTGSREAIDARMETSVGSAGNFYVGASFLGHNTGGGSGNFFGGGFYVQIDSGADSGTEAVGSESNTDVRTTVTRKVGLQVVDAATSTGSGSAFDAGIQINSQVGGVGYQYGLDILAAAIKSGSPTAIRIPNNTYLYSRNAANTADTNLIGLRNDSSGILFSGGTAAFVGGSLFSGTDNTYDLGIAGGSWANVFTHNLKLLGTTGSLTIKPPTAAGTNILTLPAGTTDFSATGGTSQVIKQTSSGGAFTVAQLAASDLSNGVSGSGAVALVTSPTLITPNIGAASAASINKLAITAPATSATLTIANTKTLTTTDDVSIGKGQYQGTATNDAATAGNIGEYVSSAVAFGAAVPLTSTVAANITSISLTAGDWDVSAGISFTGAVTTTVSALYGSIGTTSATLDITNADRFVAIPQFGSTTFSFANPNFTLPQARLSLSSTTTVYLVAQTSHAISTASGYGKIWARRRR